MPFIIINRIEYNAMQQVLFNLPDYEQLSEEIFAAYFDCRRNKRNTKDALQFEKHFEKNLFKLIDTLHEGNYYPDQSTVFIVEKPVKREIFAANFKDRIVHHWLINKLNPLFEQYFIEHSFACRVGKGTHKGIECVEDCIALISENYTKKCYILKLDIRGFFMHINKKILWNKLKSFVQSNYLQNDQQFVLVLLEKILCNNPTENCKFKGSRTNWIDLPKDKSLFSSPVHCGLPIGNFTSQVFANFYLHEFDIWMEELVGEGRYFRYVDDFVIIHPDKSFLSSIIKKIALFLNAELKLQLHPHKIYLQHCSKGLQFLGSVIKADRRYIGNRTKGNMYKEIQILNKQLIASDMQSELLNKFICIMNSYMGLIKHCNSYRLRRKIYKYVIHKQWKQFTLVDAHFLKYSIRKNVIGDCNN